MMGHSSVSPVLTPAGGGGTVNNLPVAGEQITFRVDNLNGNGDNNLLWVNNEQIGAFGGKDWIGLGAGAATAIATMSRASSVARYVTNDGFGMQAAQFSGAASLRTPVATSLWAPLAQDGNDFTVIVAFRDTSFNTRRAIWANRNTGVSAQQGADLLYDSRFTPTAPSSVLCEARIGSLYSNQTALGSVPTAVFNVVTVTGNFTTNIIEIFLNSASSIGTVSIAGNVPAIQSTQLYLGGAVDGLRMIGHIYLWSLYPRLLSAAEITTNSEYITTTFAP